MGLKLRTVPRFLASIFAGTGTAVRKDGLATYVDWDPSDFAPLSTYDPTKQNVAVQSSVDGSFGLVTIDQINGAGGIINVLDAPYSADPTYTNDCTTAIQTAITFALITGRTVYMPAGTYKIAGTLVVGGNGTTLLGDGINSTILKSPNAANAIISVGNGLTGIKISGIQFNRAVAATAGGDALQWALTGISDGFLENLWARNCYVGFKLGPTSLSYGKLLRAEGNVSHGILQTNNVTWGGNQWTLEDIYVGNNGGDGYRVASDAAAVAGMGVGNVTCLYSFANSGHGIAVIGTAASPVNSVRFFNVFLGQDGASELYVDSRSGLIQIEGGFLELAGTSNTGPGNLTAPSGVGHGVEITSNNSSVQIVGMQITGMSQSGIVTTASTITSINACHSLNNSNYGAVISDGSKVSITGSFFTNNALAPIFYSANAASAMATGNTPKTVNNHVGGARTIAASAVASTALTGTTSETTMSTGTITIPANSMGLNGVLRVTTQWSFTGAGGNRTTRMKFGGTSFIDMANGSTLLSARLQGQIANRNATNSQVASSITQANWGGNASAVATAAVDTTAAVTLLITGQLANSGDSMTLESYLVEVILP